MILFLAAAALAGSQSPSPPGLRLPAAAVAAGGEHVDRTGSRDPWVVNGAHALIWEGQPYVPAGVVLHVPAIAAGSRETAVGSPNAGGDDSAGTAVYRLPSTVS